jgi:hypothetical protein
VQDPTIEREIQVQHFFEFYCNINCEVFWWIEVFPLFIGNDIYLNFIATSSLGQVKAILLSS